MRLLILFFVVLLLCAKPLIARIKPLKNVAVSEVSQRDSVRVKWFNFITGSLYAVSDPAIKNKIELITKSAQINWTEGFVKDTVKRQFLWSDLKYNSSSDLTVTYRRLRTMALAYASSGSKLYQNKNLRDDILAAMDWLYLNKFNENVVVPRTGGQNNWWDYRIGCPEEINNIIILMYDDLGKDRRDAYVRTVKHCTPNADKFTGANLLWIARIIAMNGIIDHDDKRVKYACEVIRPVFDYVIAGDGFYRDGSFVQHVKYPYTGGYGVPLIRSLAELMYLFPSITKSITSSKNIYDWVYDAFDPLMFRGGIMSMSMGREIARSATSEHSKGKAVVETLIILSESAPEPHAGKLKTLVKTYILSDKTIPNYLSRLSTITLMQIGKSIMNDKHILPRKDYHIYKQYANMDRVVQHNSNYAFGLSMHSTRIFNYESINGENLKGWHTSDGMTYLYNADLNQYNNNFWSTVNYKRLPGTTVDPKAVPLPSKTGKSDWVGGASMLGKYGATGMELAPSGTKLVAKKSWFMFDSEIVALGAGIVNDDGRETFTYIEQRKLKDDNTNVFTIDGEVQPVIMESEHKGDVSWAHLSGNVQGADIGYYFPGNSELNIERNVQVGKWNEVNTGGEATKISRKYLTLWKTHSGFKKTIDTPGSDYAYIILPGYTANQTKNYSKKPNIQILENSAKVQAVKDFKLNIVAANFWNDSIDSVLINGNKVYLSSDKKASILIKEDADQVMMSLSDPTMKNVGVINIVYSGRFLSVISKDPGVTIESLNPILKLKFNVKGQKGKTMNIILSKN